MAGTNVAAVRPTSSRGRTARIASGTVSRDGRRPSPISEGSPSVSYSLAGEGAGAKLRSNSTLSTSASSSHAPGASVKAKTRNPTAHIRGQSTNSRSTADTAITSSPPSAGSSTASAATTSPPEARTKTQATVGKSNPSTSNTTATTASTSTRGSNISNKSSSVRAPSAPVARGGSRASSQRGVDTHGKSIQQAPSQRTTTSAGGRRPSPTASLSSAPNLTRGRTPSAPSSSASVKTKRPTTPTSAKIAAAAASGGNGGGRTGTPGSRGTPRKQNSPSRKRLPSSGRGTASPVVRSSPTPSIKGKNRPSSTSTPTRAPSTGKSHASASKGPTTKAATASSPVTQSTSVGTSSSPRSQSVTLVPLSPTSSNSSVSSFRPNANPANHQTNTARRRTAESAPAVSNRGDGNAGSTTSFQGPDKAALALLAASNMADGLSAVRDGPHATIVKLRRLLDEASRRDSSAKSNLAKSDAIILELRKSLRELKVKLTTVEGERDLQARRVVESASELGALKNDLGAAQTQLGRAEKEIRQLRNGVDRTDRDAVVGELQVKLDQAHAKLLTAEMAQRGMEEDHQNEMNELEIMVAQRDSEIEGLKEECENLTQTIMERDEALRSLADTVEDLQEEVRRGAARGSNMTALSSRLEASRMKLTDTEHALASTQEQLQEARQLVKHLDTSREEAESKVETVQQELAQVTEERDALLHQSREIDDMNHPAQSRAEDPDGEPSCVGSGDNVHKALHEKEEELQKTVERMGELELSVEEQTKQVESLRQENDFLLSRIADEEKNRSSASSVASSERLIRLQAERQTLLRSKHELEDRLRKMQGQLDIVDKEREELQRSLEAMREIQSRSSADSEIQAVHEMSVERERLKRQVGELQLILDERNIELLSLRSRLEGAESRASDEDVTSRSSRTTSRSGTRGGAAVGGGASGSTPSATSAKNRALARRIASETKLRERLGNVARLMGDNSGAAAIANGGDATSSVSGRGGIASEGAGVVSRQARRPSVSSSTGPTPPGSMAGGEADEVGGTMLAQIETLRARLLTTEADLEEARRALAATEKNQEEVVITEKSLAEVEEHAVELEADLARAREDLAVREEECSELRQSLQEAQDTISQLDQNGEGEPQSLESQKADSQSNVPADEEHKDKQRRIEELEEELQNATERVQTREAQVSELQYEVTSLEQSLVETKAELTNMKSASTVSANSKVSTIPKTMSGRVYKGNPTDDVKLRETEAELQKTIEEVKTRRNTERSLKQALRDAQNRLTKATKEQTVMVKERDEMSKRVAPLEAHISTLERELAAAKKEVTKVRKELSNAVASTREQVRSLESRLDRKDKELHEAKTRAETAEQDLKTKNKTLAKLREDLRAAQERGKAGISPPGTRAPPTTMRNKATKEAEQLKAEVEAGSEKVKELEAELLSALEELQIKSDEEERLSKSLNDALSLLKPLQGHVETAEREKDELAEQLEEAQQQLEALKAKGSSRDTSSRGAEFTKLKSEKESLEKEAKLLRKELERASSEYKVDPTLPKAEAEIEKEVETNIEDENERVRELENRLSEMKSRYETTKSKLDEASQTNMSLLEDLKHIEEEEANATEELKHLRRRLFEAEQDRDTAQEIATTALKRVEEMSGGGDGTPGALVNLAEWSSGAGQTLSAASPSKALPSVTKPVELQSATPLSQRVKALNQSLQQSTDVSSRDTKSPVSSGLARPRRAGDITQRYRAALQKTSTRDFRNPSRIPVATRGGSARPPPPDPPLTQSPAEGTSSFGVKNPTKHPTEDVDEEDEDDPRVREMNEIMNRLEKPDDVSSIAEEI